MVLRRASCFSEVLSNSDRTLTEDMPTARPTRTEIHRERHRGRRLVSAHLREPQHVRAFAQRVKEPVTIRVTARLGLGGVETAVAVGVDEHAPAGEALVVVRVDDPAVDEDLALSLIHI